MHGELSRLFASCSVIFGSSPRAWGTHEMPLEDEVGYRFIPTCMGNSRARGAPHRARSVHPHVHGELISSSTSSTCAAGSSPRAWGTPVPRGPPPVPVRFIPTCMGNSSSSEASTRSASVHPHVHGELYISLSGGFGRRGSSPRAWGTHLSTGEEPRLDRFIPTCMGNSRTFSTGRSGGAVHPHVHGELSSNPR